MVKDVLQQRHVVVAAFWSPFEVLMHHELPSQPFWLLTLFLPPLLMRLILFREHFWAVCGACVAGLFEALQAA